MLEAVWVKMTLRQKLNTFWKKQIHTQETHTLKGEEEGQIKRRQTQCKRDGSELALPEFQSLITLLCDPGEKKIRKGKQRLITIDTGRESDFRSTNSKQNKTHIPKVTWYCALLSGNSSFPYLPFLLPEVIINFRHNMVKNCFVKFRFQRHIQGFMF